jgi:hypothetical protein
MSHQRHLREFLLAELVPSFLFNGRKKLEKKNTKLKKLEVGCGKVNVAFKPRLKNK